MIVAKLLRKIDVGAGTLALSECTDGFWLWDETRKMNLSMRARSEQAALVEALLYYQRRLLEVECRHATLAARVENALGILDPKNYSEE